MLICYHSCTKRYLITGLMRMQMMVKMSPLSLHWSPEPWVINQFSHFYSCFLVIPDLQPLSQPESFFNNILMLGKLDAFHKKYGT